MPRVLKSLSTLLIGGGVVLALWPAGQFVYGRWNQRQLAEEFQREEKSFPKHPTKPKVKKVSAARPRKFVMPPWPLTRISAPDIELDAYVVQGWNDATLRRGPSHYERSSGPGEGNCVIAGHRNVYGSPFANLDQLSPGQSIYLANRDGSFTYIVDSVTSVAAGDWSVTKPPPPNLPPCLTLLTCTVPHTPSRIMVKAYLTE